jgi:hypothetical protein
MFVMSIFSVSDGYLWAGARDSIGAGGKNSFLWGSLWPNSDFIGFGKNISPSPNGGSRLSFFLKIAPFTLSNIPINFTFKAFY